MKIFIIVILCFAVILVVFYAYYGGFKRLDVTLASQGGETVVYECISGDYRQTGVVMDKVYYILLNDYDITTYKGYGKYFDNPKEVEKCHLRSEAGSIIEAKDLDMLDQLSDDFTVKTLPVEKYITVEFPYKGKISVFFSILKVYSALNEFAHSKGYDDKGAVIEIYDIPNKKILYRKEIIEE